MVRVLLERVELEGFVSYKSRQEVAFPEGVVVLVGENGSGKSSLVEAVFFALTGDYPRGRLESTINNMSKVMRVSLKLRAADGSVLEVSRERSRSGARVEDVAKLNGKEVASGRDGVTKFLAKFVLGQAGEDPWVVNKFKRLVKASIVRQGQLESFIELLESLPKQEGKKELDELIGLDSYERAFEKLKSARVGVRASRAGRYYEKTFSVTREGQRAAEQELEDFRKKVEETKSELSELRRRVEEHLGRINELEEEKELKEEELKKLEEESSAIVKAIRELEQLRGEAKLLESRERELALSVEKSLRELDSTDKELGSKLRSLPLSELSAAASKLGQVASALLKSALERDFLLLAAEVEKELGPFAEELKKLKEGGQSGALDKTLRELKAAASSYRKLKSELESSLRLAKEEAERLGKRLEEIASLASELRSPFAFDFSEPPRKLLEKARSLVKEVEEKALGAALALQERKCALKALLEALEREKASCPVCLKPLTPLERYAIVSRLRKELEEAEGALSSAKALEQTLPKLDRLKGLLSSAEELCASLERLERNAEEAKGRARLLASAYGEALLEKYEELSESLEKAKEAFWNLKLVAEKMRAAGAPAPVPELPEEPKLSALVELVEAMSSLASRVGDADRALQLLAAEARAAGLSGNAVENREVLGEIKRLLEELAESARQLAEVRARRTELEPKLEELRKLEQKLEEIRRRQELATKELKAVEERLARLRGELELIEKEIESKQEELQFYEEVVAELSRALERLGLLRYVREELLHRDGLPKALRAYVIKVLEREMNDVLSSFELSYTEASIREEEGLLLSGPYGSQEFSALSGGEKVAVALSFVIALQRVLQELHGAARGIGFLVLDEPTTYLDSDRKARLVGVLRRFKGGAVVPQLILVTHDEQLKEASDTVFLVKKTREGSRVVLEEAF